MSAGGHLLVVDDNRLNRLVLERALQVLGHRTTAAVDGLDALARLEEEPFDVVLLDVEMPGLDGYGTLERIKATPHTAHVPVIMVSAIDELDSVVRCIELGAVDYLPKPFEQALLRARVDAALLAKRGRDRELAVLRQIDLLVAAAAAVEDGSFAPTGLAELTASNDPLGGLARVFVRMADAVVAREQRLRHQLEQLRRDAEEASTRAATSTMAQLASYVAIDRLHELVEGRPLPSHATGAVLLADLAGFTTAAVERSEELGGDRGSEELLAELNRVYEAFVGAVHRAGGAVVGFAGDGVMCWFAADRHIDLAAAAHAAVHTALALQLALQRIVDEPGSALRGIALRVVVASGRVERRAVGDPARQLLDVLSGAAVAEAIALERTAAAGEVLVTREVAELLGEAVSLEGPVRATGSAVVRALTGAFDPTDRGWAEVDLGRLTPEQLRPWILPAVYDQVTSGSAGFLAELRVATALFVAFDDHDAGPRAELVEWIQAVVERHGGALLQLTPSGSGCYGYACFGAPKALSRSARAALDAATELRAPRSGSGSSPGRIGLARGMMRVGAYGGSSFRAYGAIGPQTNLAARMMQLAAPGEILLDESVRAGVADTVALQPVGPRSFRGVRGPVEVFRVVDDDDHPGGPARWLDELSPLLATVTKLASVFDRPFPAAAFDAIGESMLSEREPAPVLEELCAQGILRRDRAGDFAFVSDAQRRAAYERLLYTHRRQLHRLVVSWFRQRGADPAGSVATQIDTLRWLADHSVAAEDLATASELLEEAATLARAAGRTDDARAFLERSLVLERRQTGVSAS